MAIHQYSRVSEQKLFQYSNFFFEEISSGLYVTTASRANEVPQTVDNTKVMELLNSSNKVAVKNMNGIIYANFEKYSIDIFATITQRKMPTY